MCVCVLCVCVCVYVYVCARVHVCMCLCECERVRYSHISAALLHSVHPVAAAKRTALHAAVGPVLLLPARSGRTANVVLLVPLSPLGL